MNQLNENVPVSAGATLPQPKTAEQLAQNKLVQVMSGDRFVNILAMTALYQQSMTTVKAIETEADRVNAVSIFDAVKQAIKDADDYRLEIVGPYKKFSGMVDAQFRTIKGQLTGVKDHYGAIIADWKRKEKAIHEAKMAEAEANAPTGPVETEVDDGITKIQTQPELPLEPEATTRTSTGAKATVREFEVCKVVDAMALLKAIVSKGERNQPFMEELVEFRIGKIKELKKTLGARRKVPGVEFVKEERVV